MAVSQTPLRCPSAPPGQPRLVMLERPPGGATMRWPVRRGLLSSIWAPEGDRGTEATAGCDAGDLAGPGPFPALSPGSLPRAPRVTQQC